MKYYFQSGSSIERNGLIALRGGFCEGCGGQEELTVHHMLINDKLKKKKKIRELQHVYNLMILCKHCHVDRGGYKAWDLKVIWWYIQCGRYGYDIMMKWWKSVPLLTKDKYNLCTIDSAATRIKPILLTSFVPSVVRYLSYLREKNGIYK